MVLEPEPTLKWLREKGKNGDLSEYLEDRELKKAILDDMVRLAEECKCVGFEKIKNLKLKIDPFTIENNLLTPKMSLKRHVAKEVFDKDIEEVYKAGIF